MLARDENLERRSWEWSRPGRWSQQQFNCWFCLCPSCLPACLPALPRANTFFLNLHSCHISLLHCCTLFISPHNFTHTSISLFNSLRLGLGRFTRFPPRRLPAFHCQYHFPPTSKRYESCSRAPWPYISITKMSSSEDDKPLVKGLFSLSHARVCLVRSLAQLSRCFG